MLKPPVHITVAFSIKEAWVRVRIIRPYERGEGVKSKLLKVQVTLIALRQSLERNAPKYGVESTKMEA